MPCIDYTNLDNKEVLRIIKISSIATYITYTTSPEKNRWSLALSRISNLEYRRNCLIESLNKWETETENALFQELPSILTRVWIAIQKNEILKGH